MCARVRACVRACVCVCVCVCVRVGLRPKQDFFGVVERQYGVRPQSLTGGAKDLKDINDWVKQQTGNTIARFLAKALPRNAGVNLVGAGFFKGKSPVE